MNYIIFSDLDGTLLDHNDYSFDPAIKMIEKIKTLNIPLIFTTSKTKEECEILQKKMKIDEPFIVENGAAIFGLEEPIILGVSNEKIVQFLEKIKEEFKIKAFFDMSVEEVMEWTGFSKESALLAKNREFSEPFLIRDERELTALEELAEKEGLKILKGGRFYHLVGIEQDKGEAVKRVINKIGYDKKSIALGDNYNDVAMLKVVDIPILIPHHQNRYIDLELENLIKASFMGPRGWSEALKKVLDE